MKCTGTNDGPQTHALFPNSMPGPLSLLVGIFFVCVCMCICVFVCVYSCMCVHMCMFVHEYRSQRSVSGVHPSDTAYLILQTESFTFPWDSLILLGWLTGKSYLSPPPQCLIRSMCQHAWIIYLGSELRSSMLANRHPTVCVLSPGPRVMSDHPFYLRTFTAALLYCVEL